MQGVGRIVGVACLIAVGTACVTARGRSEAASTEAIRGACVTEGAVEVEFEDRFTAGCMIEPAASCEVVLEGDALVVTGEASWSTFDAYCDSSLRVFVARCELPAGSEAATTLRWDGGSVTLGEPCRLTCRPDADGGTCD